MFSPPVSSVSVAQTFNQIHNGSPHYLDDEEFPLTEEDETGKHGHTNTQELDTPEFERNLHKKREDGIMQLITSEKQYVSELGQLNDNFIRPFETVYQTAGQVNPSATASVSASASASSNNVEINASVLSEAYYHILFDSILAIYDVNLKLYRSLEERFSKWDQQTSLIGD
ncbi:hypothetical protein RFI_13645, partial [Reticulomyxa filosa]